MGRIILNGSKNIRDFGGIEVKDGIIKDKKIIRSDSLDKLTEEDIRILLEDYNLSTIVDLRSINERFEQENIQNIEYVQLPVFNDSILGCICSQGKLQNIKDMEIDMKEIYKKMLSEEYLNNISKIINFILDLNDNQFSVLFHCTQGKDRTGVIAAILLMILGASKETIIEDYMDTNNAYDEYYRRVKNMDEKVFYADKEHIETVFEVIENEWGSVEMFIENGLEIKKEKVKKFKKKVVEER